MELLREILLEIDNTGEKSLIFTQYNEMGKIIANLMGEILKIQIPFLHGGLSLKARDEMVHDFQNSSNVRALIISLKAGGTGLNLTAASHVIHYDLWWNPASCRSSSNGSSLSYRPKTQCNSAPLTDNWYI
jgi:SNF2 family DNA or RNA helicase